MIWVEELLWGVGLWCLKKARVLQRLEAMHEIQGADGNWDAGVYMTGMYNGVEAIMAALKGNTPVFKTPVVKEVEQDDSGWANPPRGDQLGLFDLPATDR